MGGDPNRAFDGEMHGLLTYRESHPQALRQQIEAWSEQNFYTTCQSISGPSVSTVNSGNCGYTYRETYCTQTCRTGYTAVAGYPYNWCVRCARGEGRLYGVFASVDVILIPPAFIPQVWPWDVAVGSRRLQALLWDVQWPEARRDL